MRRATDTNYCGKLDVDGLRVELTRRVPSGVSNPPVKQNDLPVHGTEDVEVLSRH